MIDVDSLCSFSRLMSIPFKSDRYIKLHSLSAADITVS
jgi:hypothetical protein